MGRNSRSFMLSAALAAGLTLSARPVTPAVPAPDMRVDLNYEVYFGGAHVAGLAIDIGLQPTAYDVKMHLKTVGLVGRLFPWWMKAYSRGLVNRNDVNPREAGQRNQWRGKNRWVKLQYDGKEVVVAGAEPAPAKNGKRAVSSAMRRDTVDLASAILRVVLPMKEGAKCTGRIAVFDGRRRYDMIVNHKLTGRLKSSRYSPFDGKAESCTVTLKRLGGFKRYDRQDDSQYEEDHGYEADHDGDRGRGWRERDRNLSVWIGRVFKNAPPLPVRLELDTPYGALKAHLHNAQLNIGGNKRNLVRRR